MCGWIAAGANVTGIPALDVLLLEYQINFVLSCIVFGVGYVY